jgi:hypothetical protein
MRRVNMLVLAIVSALGMLAPAFGHGHDTFTGTGSRAMQA